MAAKKDNTLLLALLAIGGIGAYELLKSKGSVIVAPVQSLTPAQYAAQPTPASGNSLLAQGSNLASQILKSFSSSTPAVTNPPAMQIAPAIVPIPYNDLDDDESSNQPVVATPAPSLDFTNSPDLDSGDYEPTNSVVSGVKDLFKKKASVMVTFTKNGNSYSIVKGEVGDGGKGMPISYDRVQQMLNKI